MSSKPFLEPTFTEWPALVCLDYFSSLNSLHQTLQSFSFSIDIVERFQLSSFVVMITFRNLMEMKHTATTLYLAQIVPSLLALTVSEILIDWLKHAFITKFNNITPSVYKSIEKALALKLTNKERVFLSFSLESSFQKLINQCIN